MCRLDLRPPGIDWPERPRESDAGAFGRDHLRIAAADHRDMAWLQQPLKILPLPFVHAPSGLRIAREMMWRWISEVPSQMRSSLESRQSR